MHKTGISNDFKTLIQEIANEGVARKNPVNVVYGKVSSANPLEIWLSQAITLDKEHLVLSRNVTDYEREEEVTWVTESSSSHTHQVKGVKKVKVMNSLKVGEVVSLIQLQGGQKFLVLDRVVGA